MEYKELLKKIGIKIIDISYTLTLWFIGLVLFYLGIQVFVLTSFSIPTDSMEPSILPGDKILVEKLTMGGRLFNLQKSLQKEPVDIRRVPGFSKLKRNDIIVFNWPYPDTWEVIEFDIARYYVKRCIGLPGDTVEIRDAIYVINGISDQYGNVPGQKKLQKHLEAGQEYSESVWGVCWDAYPFDETLNWSIYNFGPFYLPRKGDIVSMNETNCLLYSRLIEWEQGEKVTFRDNEIRLGEKVITSYQFQENYYFVAGDKVSDSQDSRYWGLLPEELIVGKAWRVLYSKKQGGGFRADRFLKKLQ